MDADQFDVLTRSIAQRFSRRLTFKALTAGLAAVALGQIGPEPAAAAKCQKVGKSCKRRPGKPKPKCCPGSVCKKNRCQCKPGRKKCGQACLTKKQCCRNPDCPSGATCNKKHKCVAPPPGICRAYTLEGNATTVPGGVRFLGDCADERLSDPTIVFETPATFTFSDLIELSVRHHFTVGTCGETTSPRFFIVSGTPEDTISVHIGPEDSVGDCASTGPNGSGNLIDSESTALRFDFVGTGIGPLTYTQAHEEAEELGIEFIGVKFMTDDPMCATDGIILDMVVNPCVRFKQDGTDVP